MLIHLPQFVLENVSVFRTIGGSDFSLCDFYKNRENRDTLAILHEYGKVHGSYRVH